MRMRIVYLDAVTRLQRSVEIDADPASFSVQIDPPPLRTTAVDPNYWYDDFLKHGGDDRDGVGA
jgi:hypothetical protein